MKVIKVRFKAYYKQKSGRIYPYIVGALSLGGWALDEGEKALVLSGGEVEKEFVLLSKEELKKLEEPIYEIDAV